MNEEIKEILDRIKKQLEIDESAGMEIAKDFHKTILSYKEIKLLLDYITNLQEENTKLKELCDKYEEEHTTTFNYWKELIKEDYKSRCEKAIDYLEERKERIKDTVWVEMDEDAYIERISDIENILQGSDKE